MSGYTKGPWEFEDIGEEGDNLRINQWERMEANKVAIAIIPVGYSEPFESEQHANARLIASAPELLEALEACQAELATLKARLSEPYRSNIAACLAKAKAALAKARGRE